MLMIMLINELQSLLAWLKVSFARGVVAVVAAMQKYCAENCADCPGRFEVLDLGD